MSEPTSILRFDYHEEDRSEYPFVFDISADPRGHGMDIIVALMELRSRFRDMFPVEEREQVDDPWRNRRYLFGAGQVAFQSKQDATLFRLVI